MMLVPSSTNDGRSVLALREFSQDFSGSWQVIFVSRDETEVRIVFPIIAVVSGGNLI